jgi:hypothetical protein
MLLQVKKNSLIHADNHWLLFTFVCVDAVHYSTYVPHAAYSINCVVACTSTCRSVDCITTGREGQKDGSDRIC